jgi:hypothetical protein
MDLPEEEVMTWTSKEEPFQACIVLPPVEEEVWEANPAPESIWS